MLWSVEIIKAYEVDEERRSTKKEFKNDPCFPGMAMRWVDKTVHLRRRRRIGAAPAAAAGIS